MNEFVYKAIAQTQIGMVYSFAHDRSEAVAMTIDRLERLNVQGEIKVYIYTGGEEATQ